MRSFGNAERAGSVTAVLGEGPRWDAEAGRLLWVDIEGGLLHADDRTIEGGSMVCAVAPWAGDTVLVALADALAAVDVEDGSVRRLVEIPHGSPGMRCNDGACDPAGRFWIGTMALDERPGAGALFCYEVDGTLHGNQRGSSRNGDIAAASCRTPRPGAIARIRSAETPRARRVHVVPAGRFGGAPTASEFRSLGPA